MLHAAHGQVRQDDGQDKIWTSATVDTLWEKDSGVWLYKPNEEACERGLRVNGLRLTAGGVLERPTVGYNKCKIKGESYKLPRHPHLR